MTKTLFSLLLLLGALALVSCSLNFPEDAEEDELSKNSSSSSLATEESSSSGTTTAGSSSNSEGDSSSSSVNGAGDPLSSSSNPVESSSSSGTESSSSSAPMSSGCSASENTETHYCSGGVMQEYGSVSYEGKTYKTVVIGTQTWMNSNLNYDPKTGKTKCYAQGRGNGEDDWLTPEAAQVNCEKYGRLYDWATAMNLPATCNTTSCEDQVRTTNRRGICPEGWHIPSLEEWNTLRTFIEDEIFENYEDEDFGWGVATKLKALSGWKESNTADHGVDSYGFSAIASGYCVNCEQLSDATGYYAGSNRNETQSDTREEAHWWSSTEFVNPYNGDTKEAYKNKITHNKIVMTQERENKTDYLYSIRCIKN